MKRISTYFILAIFLAGTAGFLPFLQLHRHYVHRNIQSYLLSDPSQLVTIRVEDPENNPDFKRLDSREFIFQGRLYDIGLEVVNGKTTTFLCLHDQHEEAILKTMKRNGDKQFASNWWDHTIKQAFPAGYDSPGNSYKPVVVFGEVSFPLEFPDIFPLTPPPKSQI